MSTVLSIEPTAEPQPQPRGGRGSWHLTWQGVRTVTVLELRQRLRSTRWVLALVAWFLVVGAITGLSWQALSPLDSDGTDSMSSAFGPVLFGLIVFFVLFLGLLVAPTLSATSINGDRAAGTLAVLQVTLLSPAEIVFGKLLASWVAALAFLAASVPFVVVAMSAGGTPVVAMFVCLGVLALLLAAVCAIGLGFSALTARTSGSAVLTYITVACLSVLGPILFGLTYNASLQTDTVRVWGVDHNAVWDSDEAPTCSWSVEERSQAHTERTWWLLGMNPFVVVADAAPQPTKDGQASSVDDSDPLALIRSGMRQLRAGAPTEIDECWTWVSDGGTASDSPPSPVAARTVNDSAVWPWGLGANLVLGAAGVWVAVRRLSIPRRTLPRGSRVA